jgi:flagellar biosynthesis protein FlhG
VKSFSELDHYELLELSREADFQEVERAYKLALATFADGSLATYSVYADDEAEALRERVHLAFEILSDPEQRAGYDRLLASVGDVEAITAEAVDITLDLDEGTGPRPEVLPAIEQFEEALDEGDAPYDGARLRRNRLQRGLDLEEISRITKVSLTYLRFIEEDRFDGLPAPVYVRGFVTAYARCLGLEATRVVGDYMERVDTEPQSQGVGGGLFGSGRRRR